MGRAAKSTTLRGGLGCNVSTVIKCAKVGKSGQKWAKVSKSGQKWAKVGKSGQTVHTHRMYACTHTGTHCEIEPGNLVALLPVGGNTPTRHLLLVCWVRVELPGLPGLLSFGKSSDLLWWGYRPYLLSMMFWKAHIQLAICPFHFSLFF